jgi:hypothetical protein
MAADDDAHVQFGRDRFIDLRETSPAFIAGRLLLTFSDGDRFVIDTPLQQQLVVATFGRSQDTYRGILSLLLDGLPTQAAILGRSLFEDLVVGHWLVLNAEDPDWLIQRFRDHRDAMALYQRRLADQTGWRMGPPIVDDTPALRRRQNELGKAFKGEAQRDWWDPGEHGKGAGAPIGLRGVTGWLEDAAARHQAFHPRFAGGEEPLLRRMELVAHKYFSQLLHHTAIGLPIEIVDHGDIPNVAGDPSEPAAFATWWMFAQQLYLLHDLYGRAPAELNERVRFGFVEAFGAQPGDLTPFPYTDR